MRRKAYIIAGGLIVIVVAAIIIVSVGGRRGRGAGQIRTARVEIGSIVVKVTETGVVAPLTIVNVKSELAGEVRQLFAEEGDSVKAGERLALVQQESSQAQQIAQARASVERAKLDLEDAKRDLERKQDLYEKDFIAMKDVEDAEQTYKRSQIQYELSEKQLWVVLGGGAEEAESGGLGAKAFDNITVTAPISGVVISLNVEQGEMITSGTQAYGGGGTVLMTIADLSKMVVTTDVNEVDVGKIRVGQSAQIGFDAIRDRVYSGVVKRIAPAGAAEGNVVVFPVEVEITGSISGVFQGSPSGTSSRSAGDRLLSRLPEDQQNALRRRIRDLREQGAGREEIQSEIEKAAKEYGGAPFPAGRPESASGSPTAGDTNRAGVELIKPGMTADLDIIIARAENVLYLPKEAIITRDGGTAVMLLEDGKEVLHPVVSGLEDNVNVEIREGLKEDDEVLITNGQPAPGQQQQSRQSPPRGGPPI